MTSAAQVFSFSPMRDPRAGAIYVVLVMVCLGVAIFPALQFVSNFWGTEEYSHVYLIPPLALLTFVYRYQRSEIGGPTWPGVAMALFAGGLMLLGSVAGLYTVVIYGAVTGIFALVWSGTGTRGLRTLAAPVVYLGFMVPFPKALYMSLSATMQHLSSQIGVAVMQFAGVSVLLDGNIIDLGSSKLEVAAACNGLRYLFPLLSFGFLIAMLLEDAFWKKCVLVASTLPIAVVMNAGRIAMIGLLVDRFGIHMAEGTQHEVEGFVVFFLCIVMLLGEVWLLLRIGSRGRFLALDVLLPDRSSMRAVTRWPLSTTLLVAGLVLAGGGLAVEAMPQRQEIVPDRRPLSLFPMEVADWKGSPGTMGGEFLDMLKLTDYVLADYVRPDSDVPVNFYVAYYESQRFGIQSHSPQQCIPGGGWNIIDQSLVEIPKPDGTSFPVNRLLIERQGVKQLAYFWFDERGRVMTNEFQLRYFAIRDSIVRGRSDGALIRLVTPVIDGDTAAADKRLRDFNADVTVLLDKYVPN